MVAEFATTLVQLDLFEKVPVSFYKESPALRAIRIAALVPGYIPKVNISEALPKRHLPQFLQSRDGRRRQPREPVLGKKPEEMKRIIRTVLLQNPSAHSLDHLRVFHIGRHHEGGDFQPDPLLVEELKGVEHGLQRSAVQGAIETIIKGLEIDICTIQDFAEIKEGLPIDVPVGNKNILEPCLPP